MNIINSRNFSPIWLLTNTACTCAGWRSRNIETETSEWACLKPLTNQQYATCGACLRCWLHAYRAGMLKLLSQAAAAPQKWRCCSWCLCFVLTRFPVHCWSRLILSKFSGFGLFFGFRLQFSCSSVTRRYRNGVNTGAAEKVPRGKGEADGCDGERDAAQETRKQRNHQFGSPPENALGCMFYFAGILTGKLIIWILQHHTESTTHLKELYEDKDGLRKDEVALLSGPNEFGEFYSRLRGIKEFYRKHPNEVLYTNWCEAADHIFHDVMNF